MLSGAEISLHSLYGRGERGDKNIVTPRCLLFYNIRNSHHPLFLQPWPNTLDVSIIIYIRREESATGTNLKI